MEISVVIPTRNRRDRLLAVLDSLSCSTVPFLEVIVVDASEVPFVPQSVASRYPALHITCIVSEGSVCIQRNKGIRAAMAPWILLCDDDVELPANYVQQLAEHIRQHPEAGAVSGLFLQLEKGIWTGMYPLTSGRELLLKYIFGLSVWGPVVCHDGWLLSRIKAAYQSRGNHLSKAGWPVLTNFGEPYWETPLYSLGVALVRKEWLQASPFDEVLDPHGIGDNYGVALGFPSAIQVLQHCGAYHHKEKENRLQKPQQYYRRALALDYFIRQGKAPAHVRRRWLIWSLFGNWLIFLMAGDRQMVKPAFRTLQKVWRGKNPYSEAAARNQTKTEPLL